MMTFAQYLLERLLEHLLESERKFGLIGFTEQKPVMMRTSVRTPVRIVYCCFTVCHEVMTYTTKEEFAGIPYEIRRRKQAKRMVLRIASDGRVWISLPLRGSIADAREFFRKHIDHTTTTLAELRAKRSAAAQDGLVLPVRGQWLPVELRVGNNFGMSIVSATTGASEILHLQTPPENAIHPDHHRHAAHAKSHRLLSLDRQLGRVPRGAYATGGEGASAHPVKTRQPAG